MRTLFVVLALIVSASAQLDAQVNGYREDIEGIPVFHVWGTDFEMGYALGYLDGDRAKFVLEELLIPMMGGPAGWEEARTLFSQYFTVPQRMEDMVNGVITGIGDRPDSILYSEVLGRDCDVLDIYVANSDSDLAPLLGLDLGAGCTSLTAWDGATESDPELLGAPAMVRNLDGPYHPLVFEIPAVIALNPDEGSQTVLLGHTLRLDCTSGMNEHGICVTANASNHEYVTEFDPAFVPLGYAATMGLLEDDFDGSGTNDLEDLLRATTNWNRVPSKILHTAAPRGLGHLDEPAVIVELNNAVGYEFRYADDDTALAPDHLVATNHHRILYPPVPCWRYGLLGDSIAADPQVDLSRLWDLMGSCDQSNCTRMTTLLLPEARRVGIAFADASEEAWEKDPVWMGWDELFPGAGGVAEGDVWGHLRLTLYPNPSPGDVTARFVLPAAGRADLAIYDVAGRKLRQRIQQEYAPGSHLAEFDQLPVGVYLFRMIAGNVTESRKVVVVGK